MKVSAAVSEEQKVALALAQQVYQFSINHPVVETELLLRDLYQIAVGKVFNHLSTSMRQKLGRHFRVYCDTQVQQANTGELVIMYDGINLQGAAVYQIMQKVKR